MQRTFQGEHKKLHCIVLARDNLSIAPEVLPLTRTIVLLICRIIVACSIGLDSLLDLLNGAAQEVCLAHIRKSAGLNATAVAKCSFLVYARRVGE
jgi:hypothetical protein